MMKGLADTADTTFPLLIVAREPYALVDAVAQVPVIAPQVCRDLERVESRIRQASFGAVLVELEDDCETALRRIRNVFLGKPIIGLTRESQEHLAIRMLGPLLDDYVLDSQFCPFRFVHTIRQARRLAATASALKSQQRAIRQLNRDRQRLLDGLATLRELLRASTLEGTESETLIRSLQEDDSPIRQNITLQDLMKSLKSHRAAWRKRAEVAIDAEQFAGGAFRRTYADPEQIATGISAFVNDAIDSGAQQIRLWAREEQKDGSLLLGISHDGSPLSPEILSNVLARFPKRSCWKREDDYGRRVMRLNMARKTIKNNLGEVRFGSSGKGGSVAISLPPAHPEAVVSTLADAYLLESGPQAAMTMLQVRVPTAESNPGSRLQELLRPAELALPTSHTNWLLAMPGELIDVERRIQQLRSQWNQSGMAPLVIRPVGHWTLAEQRDEMIASIQTLAELGDLSIETHPRLLLIRPGSVRSDAEATLDQRLTAAGYEVVTTDQAAFSEAMCAYQPHAVVLACDQAATETAVDSLATEIETAMEAVAQIPIVLLSAEARRVQKTMQRSIRVMDGMLPESQPHIATIRASSYALEQ